MSNAPKLQELPEMEELPKMKEKPKNDFNGEPAPDVAWGRVEQPRRLGGIILIALGVLFLLQQVFGFNLSGNWWSIFIFLPAGSLLYNAYTSYVNNGGWTESSRKQVAGGSMLLLVAVLALFGSWNLWPLFLIVGGGLALFGFNR